MYAISDQKEKLQEDLREAMKTARKESDLTTIESQIKGLETRIKYSKTDKDNTEKKVTNSLRSEIEKLEKDYATFEPRVKQLEQSMREREGRINEIKARQNTVEDDVFRDFCEQIGVANIREYEERELHASQEREKQRAELENQKNRLVFLALYMLPRVLKNIFYQLNSFHLVMYVQRRLVNFPFRVRCQSFPVPGGLVA